MALYDEDKTTEYKRVEVSCKNCDKHIVFFKIPKNEPVVGESFCTLKCISDYAEKEKALKKM